MFIHHIIYTLISWYKMVFEKPVILLESFSWRYKSYYVWCSIKIWDIYCRLMLTLINSVDRRRNGTRIVCQQSCVLYFYHSNISVLEIVFHNSFLVYSSLFPSGVQPHQDPLIWIPIHLLSTIWILDMSYLSIILTKIAITVSVQTL